MAQETRRDLGHVQYGLAAMTNAAETALGVARRWIAEGALAEQHVG